MILETILTNIGAFFGYAVLGVGTVSAVTYALFKMFSEKWLNAKFEKRLAEARHEQQKELEQIRYKINALMDRTIKLHQREFEVLPDAWAQLADAYASVRSIVIGFQQYPDLNKLNDAQLSEVLKGSDLPLWKQEEIKGAPDKTLAYRIELQWKRKNIASNEYYKLQDYLRKNGIFVRKEIMSQFTVLADLIHMALIQHEMNLENPHQQNRDHIRKFVEDGEVVRSKLEKLVQDRLWDSHTINADPS